MTASPPRGPLADLSVLELAGLGPAPFAALLLAELGARVVRIERPGGASPLGDVGGLARSRPNVAVDTKHPLGREVVLRLVDGADVLIEGFRPGVAERLGLGPQDCLARNERLVYGRMTGWGQTGPLAQAAGHDLNYVALTGLLSLSAHRGQKPIVPPTVVGDAAGALGLAFGIVCAVLDARASGQGRVVDGAIVDVVAMLGGIAQMVRASGQLDGAEPSPFHDSPFYDVYACADGGFITLGALEPQFHALLLDKLDLTDVDPATQYDKSTWPALKARFTALFASRPRDHWCALLEGSDVCFAPVLSLDEAARHPHNLARGIYRCDANGGLQVAAAPRFKSLAGHEA